jgi:release factor glutamine methyltransferase
MEPFCKKVLFVDINSESVDCVSNLIKDKCEDKCFVVESDLFSGVPAKFKGGDDVIVFNPPYLPREKSEVDDVELTSGVSGIDVTSKFICSSKPFLKKNGRLFFVVSSLSDVSSLNSLLKREGFSFDVAKSDHFFFEDIMIYEAWLDER